MAAKGTFTDEQKEILHEVALRVWKKMKADKKTQEDLALALGITQQSVSNLLKGTYAPGLKVARDLAILDGRTLEQLLPDFSNPTTSPGITSAMAHNNQFPNLDLCVQFYASSRLWSPWTVAAARAGFFGATDFAAPEWAGKLDHLEKALERSRKAS